MNLGILDEETTKLFKDYLKQTIKPLTPANPDLLSDYVYTILKKDKIEDETKPRVIDKLKDFLKNEAEAFVNQIFEVLRLLDDKDAFANRLRQLLGLEQKKPESKPHPKPTPKPTEKPVDNTNDTEPVEVVVDVDTQEKPVSPRRSRSRSRSRERSRSRSRSHSRSDEERPPKRRRIETTEDSRPPRDSRDRGRGGRGRGRGRGGHMGQEYRTRPCRDFNELGYCLRGENCPYSHGTNVVAINDLDKLQQFNVPMQMAGAPMQPGAIPPDMMMGHAVPVFDPDMNPHQGPRGPMPRMQPHDQNGDSYMVPISKPYNNNNKRKYSDRDNAGPGFNQTMRENNDENSREERDHHRPGRGGKSGRGGRDNQRGGYNQGGGHQQGPHIKGTNRDNKMLDVIHIPVEFMNADKLREHFEKFGTITNINLIAKNKAQIEYSNHFEAKAAVKSPEAVFGNRFINVYWARDQPKDGEKPEGDQPRDKPEVKPHVPVDPAAMKLVSEEAERKEKENQEAMKKLKEKQQELKDQRLNYIKKQQKMLEDLLQMSKREGLSKQELEQIFGQINTVKTLLKNALEEQQKAVAASPSKPKLPVPFVPHRRVPPPHFEAAEAKPVKTEPGTEGTSEVTAATPAEGENVEALKARLASLKQELQGMGGDPNAPAVPPGTRPPFVGTRRVRGRGGRVPRGGPAPYYPPRGAMKLDNRTTQFKLHNLPEGLDQNKLTEHFKAFGGVVSVEVHGNEATVKMDNRRNAEMAISRGSSIDAHKLTASWFDPNARPSQPGAGNKNDDEVNVDDNEGPVVEEIIAGEDHDYAYDNNDA